MTPPGRRRVLLVLAGAASAPGDVTPLSDAETPGLDQMARRGRAGMVSVAAGTPWNGFTALLGLGEDAAALGAAEAAGAGIDVPAGSSAWRADFVTLDDVGLRDPAGGKVREPEATILLDAVREALPGVALHRLEGHRNLAIAAGPAEYAPSPWEMFGRRPLSGLAEGGRLRPWFEAARTVLAAHDVNHVRVDLLENPANALWFHGGGPGAAPGLRSALSASNPVLVGRGGVTAGLARALGWKSVVVDGDDEALAAEALARIPACDLVVVRSETILWATASQTPGARRDALSAADARLVRPLLGALEECDAFTFVVASDSTIDARSGALLRRPVPIAVLASGDAGDAGPFTEHACERSGFHVDGAAGLAAVLAP